MCAVVSLAMLVVKVLSVGFKTWIRRAWMDLDVLIVLLQIAAIVIFWVYVYGPDSSVVAGLKLSYSFYDSAVLAPARFLLPSKQGGGGLPGMPGRWQLPDDLSDTEAYLELLSSLEHQYTLLTAYSLLQVSAIAFAGLRGLLATMPIPRLGVTMRSLQRALPELLYFLVIAFACSLSYMVLGSLAFGWRIEKFNSLGSSLSLLWEFQLAASWEDVLYELFDPVVARTPAETALLWLFFLTVPLFFLLILFNFLKGILLESFRAEKGTALDGEESQDFLQRLRLIFLSGLSPDESRILIEVLQQVEEAFAKHNPGIADVTPPASSEGGDPEEDLLRKEVRAALLDRPEASTKLLSGMVRDLPVDKLEELIMDRLPIARHEKQHFLATRIDPK
mmetsp:Transcript_23683/g.59563  ORF Transcript_23683/g.59563 Transcript_23683/m.59563 type:complete len:391 (-) Transcript_23683:274-1446(-)